MKLNKKTLQHYQDSDSGLTIRLAIKTKRRNTGTSINLANPQANPKTSTQKPTRLQAALARGFHWLAMLENNQATSLRDIAKKEGIDNSYISRMTNLTTLAPDIISAILNDTLPEHITLFKLSSNTPKLWDKQRAMIWGKHNDS